MITLKQPTLLPLREVGQDHFTFIPRFIEGSFDPVKRTVDVIIVTSGLGNLRDMNYYMPDAIREAVQRGVFNGPAFADHPGKTEDKDRPERSIRDIIGYYKEPRVVETLDQKTRQLTVGYGSKLRILEGQDWALNLIKECIEFQKLFPTKTLAGISINADGDTVPGEINGQQVNKVTRISEAFSADVVTKPARGGKFLNLVEGANGALKEATLLTTVVDIAGRLTKLAEGKEVDPKELQDLATSLVESEKLREAQKTETKEQKEAREAKESADAEEARKREAAQSDCKNCGHNAHGDEPDGECDTSECECDDYEPKGSKESKTDPDASIGDPDKDGGKTEARKKEAATFLSGLEVSELQTMFPSMWQSALREAHRHVGKDKTVAELRQELAETKGKLALLESSKTAESKLRESKIPQAAFAGAFARLLGHTSEEMDAEIKLLEAMMPPSTKSTRESRGAGASEHRTLPLRESDVSVNTNALLAGMEVSVKCR